MAGRGNWRRLRTAGWISAGLVVGVVAALLVHGHLGPGTVPSAPTEGDSSSVRALAAELAVTPPMGWNPYNQFGCDPNEARIESAARAMVDSGMAAAGYRYVNIDDCWALPNRDAGGHLVPDPKRFPHGIKAVSDYVHGLGLKLGIYADAGTRTCDVTTGFPGSYGHEQIDADTFAAWGVDYLKYDNCYPPSVAARDRYKRMGDALKNAEVRTRHPMVFSLCDWGRENPWEWAESIGGQLWRTTDDIDNGWTSLLANVHQNMRVAAFAHPGAWNDPDMLEVGSTGKGNGEPALTPVEQQTNFTLWAEMAAPLIAGNDLTSMAATTSNILLNAEVIAVDQDRLGKQGVVVSSANGLDVFAKELAGGGRAVVLFNETGSTATISTTASSLGLPSAAAYSVKDLWTKATSSTTAAISAAVPAHAALMYLVQASQK